MKHVKLVGTFSLVIQIWLGDSTAFRYFFIFLTYVYDLSYLPERFVVTLNKILNAFKYLWNIYMSLRYYKIWKIKFLLEFSCFV